MNRITTQHRKRQRAEQRFRLYGKVGITLAVTVLIILLGSITLRGASGFLQTQIKLPIVLDTALLEMEPGDNPASLPASSYNRLAQASLKNQFPELKEHQNVRELDELISVGAGAQIKHILSENPSFLSSPHDIWFAVSSDADLYVKERHTPHTPQGDRKLSDEQAQWMESMKKKGEVRVVFNSSFFTQGDSRTPEQAGFLSAMVGSALTLIVCLAFVFPIGVMTAVYLEEFARKSKLVDAIEVNINNLAAVPSIVFGLLGLAVYINFFGMPRSAPLVGGLTLALMTLPIIIITTRVALKAVPPSIRDAARALGASPLQVVWHHSLPLAMPGIMTGTILGMARAIGETAPLLMIGMVAFVADTPTGFVSSATVMPVQIYLWASSPEAGFSEKTATGILTLLVLLLAMNALAIVLRKRFETRW